MNSSNRVLLANYLKGQSDRFKNYIKNANAFKGTEDVAVANSATVTRNTTTPLTAISDFSVSLPNNANGYVEWEVNTLDSSLKNQNCELSLSYTASSIGSAVKFQVLQNSVEVASSSIPVISSNPVKLILNAPCGDLSVDTTVRLTNSTGNSGTSAVKVANLYYGEATNVGSVSQAQFIGSAFIDTTGSCTWDRTGTSLGPFPTNSNCPGPTVEFNPGPGIIQTTDTDLPKFTVNNLPPGYYKVIFNFSGGNQTSSNRTAFAINDGTTTSGRTSIDPSTPTQWPITVIAFFNYTTSGNRSFELYASTSANSVTIGNSASNIQMRFSIEKYPSTSEQVYKPEVYSWKVDANIGGANPSLGSSNQASYVEITDGSLDLVTNPGSLPVKIACSSTNPPTGSTCSAGSESIGINFDLPVAGEVQACVSFSHRTNLAASEQVRTTFQIVETPSNAQTILQEGNTRINSAPINDNKDATNPIRLCGNFIFNSAGNKTLRLMYEQTVSAGATSNTILADRSSSLGQVDIHWEVYPKTQYVTMPVIINSVMTPYAGQLKYISVSVAGASISSSCNSAGACTLYDNNGFTSVTRTATPGEYTLVWPAFSGNPQCWYQSYINTIGSPIPNGNPPSTTGVTVVASGDLRFHAFCIGPK